MNAAGPAAGPADDLHADWLAFRAQREETLREPHGWLSLVGLHWLDPEAEDGEVLPGVPGRWRSDGTAVHVGARRDDGLAVDGTAVDGTVRLEPVEGAPGVLVSAGDVVLEVALRTGSHAVRVRDPRSPTRLGFSGVPTFPPSARWVRPATVAPVRRPTTVTTGAVVPGLVHHHRVAATVTLLGPDGAEHTLLAFAGAGDGLTVLFTDETSGVSTYPACRAVQVPAPDAGGRAVVDLNRAVNLPCAFTDHATCPVAPAENRLPFAVEAGEKLP